jgi:hypothetical protein
MSIVIRILVVLVSAAALAVIDAGPTIRAVISSHTDSTQDKAQKPKPVADEDPVPVTERRSPDIRAATRDIAANEFGTFWSPDINAKGDVSFLGRFPAGTNGIDQSIFVRHADGKWETLATGQKVANLEDPISAFGGNVTMNESGDLSFIASVGGPRPVKADNSPGQREATSGTQPVSEKKTAVVIKTAAGMKSIAHTGEGVPNMPSRFSGFANASLNTKGIAAFVGTYIDPDGKGLFMVEGDKLTLVARSGQKTGTNATAVFSEHYYPSAINERGEVAFFSRISAGSGIFIGRMGGVEAIALQGQESPIKGAKYLGFGNRTPSISNKGHVAFAGFYDGPEAGRGLFLKDDQGVKLVAKSGDTLPDSGYVLADFLIVAINSRDEIAFVGTFGGRNRGVFLKTAKGIEAIALMDQQAPGLPKGETFNNFAQLSLNERGELVFYGQTKSANVGIFIKDAKGLRSVVMRGEKRPM